MNDYQNPNLCPEDRAKSLLAQLSLEEKMAQVVCCFPRRLGDTQNTLAEYPTGAGHVSTLEMRMLTSLEDCVRFQREVQTEIMDRSPHHIPALFHMEGLCGAFIQGAVSFPSGIARAATWDPALERQVGEIVGRQERCVGITETFAPVLDITRDSRMGRRGEPYGEDPTLAAAMGVAYTTGLQSGETGGRKTEAVAKHFLGFHASQGGIHGTDCQIGERELREVYAKPFQAAITEAGLRGIMPCYNIINGKPVSVTKELLSGLLRDEMGFDGMTVSDYCAISNVHNAQGLYESDAQAGLRALDAGMDVELQFKQCYNAELEQMFAEGKADMALLDQAVERVLEAKFRMGLFEHPFPLEKEALNHHFHIGNEEATSLQAARESLVLLKNDGLLPLSGNIRKLAVIGPHADEPRFFFGGYTHFSLAEGNLSTVSTMAGLQTEKGKELEIDCFPDTNIERSDAPKFKAVLDTQKPGCESILSQLRKRMPNTEVIYSYGYDFVGTDRQYFDGALKAAKDADVILVTLGGKHGSSTIASMGEGMDGININLPGVQEEFLKKLSELKKPIVAVHLDGRAISSDNAERYCGAILETWSPAEQGGVAIVDALLGSYNPGGKLPVSVAYHAAQLPMYYNHPNNSSYHQGGSIAFSDYVDCPHRPRYFFGYGLSYTTFSYSNLHVARLENGEAKLEIAFDLTNTGKTAGDEIAQLYFRDCFASRSRPVKELAGFVRVHLLPGETKHITFTIRESQFAFLDDKMQWIVEAGQIDLTVGASSEDIRLQQSIVLPETYTVDGKTRGFYAHTEVQ